MVSDIFVKNWVVGSLSCCYGNTVFSGPFQTQKADSILFLLHKARGKLKVKTCQFSNGKTFLTSEIQSQVKKLWQSIILISLINEGFHLFFKNYFALLLEKKISPSSFIISQIFPHSSFILGSIFGDKSHSSRLFPPPWILER